MHEADHIVWNDPVCILCICRKAVSYSTVRFSGTWVAHQVLPGARSVGDSRALLEPESAPLRRWRRVDLFRPRGRVIEGLRGSLFVHRSAVHSLPLLSRGGPVLHRPVIARLLLVVSVLTDTKLVWFSLNSWGLFRGLWGVLGVESPLGSSGLLSRLGTAKAHFPEDRGPGFYAVVYIGHEFCRVVSEAVSDACGQSQEGFLCRVDGVHC